MLVDEKQRYQWKYKVLELVTLQMLFGARKPIELHCPSILLVFKEFITLKPFPGNHVSSLAL